MVLERFQLFKREEKKKIAWRETSLDACTPEIWVLRSEKKKEKNEKGKIRTTKTFTVVFLRFFV